MAKRNGTLGLLSIALLPLAAGVALLDPAPPATGAAAPAFRDDFEAGRLARPQGGIAWGGGNRVRVSDANARSGRYALRAAYPGTTPRNPPRAQQSLDLPELREFWVEYYVHVPDNFAMEDAGTADNKKWFLVKDADRGGSNNAMAVYMEYDTNDRQAPGARLLVKWEVDEGTPDYAYKTTSIDNFITPEHRGRWVQFRAHVKLASTRSGNRNKATGDGIIQIWRDGDLVYENLRAPLKAVSPAMSRRNHFGYGYVLGAANRGFPRETVFDIDDFKLYTASPRWR